MDIDSIANLVKSKDPDYYNETHFSQLKDRLEEMTPFIRKALALQLAGEPMPEINLSGYTFEKLTKEHKMEEIGALLALDWIIRDPESALRVLEKMSKKGWELTPIFESLQEEV